jgi:thiol-disulfide isomerase/thioredoxin
MSLQKYIENINTVSDIETRTQFKNFMNPNKKYLLYFTATWCNPCKITKPKLFEYLKFLKNKELDFEFLMFDVDISSDVVRHLKIKAFPTLMCIINNNITDICVGSGDEDLNHFFNSSYQKLIEKS